MNENEMVEALAGEVRKEFSHRLDPIYERLNTLNKDFASEQSIAGCREQIANVGERVDGLRSQVDDLAKLRERITALELRDVRAQQTTLRLKEDGRTLVFKFGTGEDANEYEIECPWQIYRGIYKHKSMYHKGDVVTYGGSQYVAIRSTMKAPTDSASWTCCVKRGRDANQ